MRRKYISFALILYPISIHAPRVGCDSISFPLLWLFFTFQSTHPGWGATLCAQSINNVPFYFNPRTPGGVRRYLLLYQQRTSDISIHAPRVGCDLPTQSLSIWTYPISIHAPRVGCDLLLRLSVQYKLQFQSTHPGWGATNQSTSGSIVTQISIHAPRVGCDSLVLFAGVRIILNFNPRTPGGVRLRVRLRQFPSTKISIHAPRVGCDRDNASALINPEISIHAPRVGCDPAHPSAPGTRRDFNPRTPVGCDTIPACCGRVIAISIHAPGWGATYLLAPDFSDVAISIHAPRVGCDSDADGKVVYNLMQFQSTHPGWGATLYDPYEADV